MGTGRKPSSTSSGDRQQRINFAAATDDRRNTLQIYLRYHCPGADLRHWTLVEHVFRLARGDQYRRSLEQIAGLLWCSRDTARRIVRDLETWGVLTTEEQVLACRGQRENAYSIDWETVYAMGAKTKVNKQTPPLQLATPPLPVATPIKEDTAFKLHLNCTSSSRGGLALEADPVASAQAQATEEEDCFEEHQPKPQSQAEESTSKPVWISGAGATDAAWMPTASASGLPGEEMADLALRLKSLGLVATGRLVAGLDAAGVTLAEVDGVIAYWQSHRDRFQKPAAALYTRLKNHTAGQPADQGWGRSLPAAERREQHAKRDAAIAKSTQSHRDMLAQAEREAAESRERQEPLRAMTKIELLEIARRMPAGFARSQVERLLAGDGPPSDLVLSILQSQLELLTNKPPLLF